MSNNHETLFHYEVEFGSGESSIAEEERNKIQLESKANKFLKEI
jgi:hypothetical protein